MHPKSERMYEVVERFRSVQDMAGYVYMSEIYVEELHCGTVACMAGWYSVAVDLDERGFTHGAMALSAHLGFSRYMEFALWAQKNPRIWGNIWGLSLYDDRRAYDAWDCTVTLSVKQIADHLEKVANNLKKLEEIEWRGS